MATTLDQLIDGLEKLDGVEAVRRKNNSYALDSEGRIIALSLSGSALESLVLDEKAAALEHLYLGENEGLKEVRFSAQLPRLRHLDLHKCALTSVKLPAGFGDLRQLYLQSNQLAGVLLEGNYPALELLDASNNQLSAFALPDGCGALRALYLGDNSLKTLNLGKGLGHLEILYLQNNQLNTLPQDVILSEALESLYLAGNAPKDIPKVFLGNPGRYYISDCREAAQIWFSDLRDYPSQENKTVKLMLIGNGNAGKSSVLCALKNGKCAHNHDTTHGIEIEALQGTDVTYNVWDFGGQEVYHGTHRLFIGSEAIQAIVFEPETEELARKNELVKDRANNDLTRHHPVKYWYETTRELSPDSQFVIVQNKKDRFEEIDDIVHGYAKGVKARFVHLSAKNGEDVDVLDLFLKKLAKELPDYDMRMPESWLKVRQFFIDNLQSAPGKGKKLISKQDFDQLCKDCRVREITQSLLFRYLHHNGFLYHHEYLGDHIIADQRWALDAIYQPLNRKAGHYEEFKEDWRGKIRVRRLFQVFDENPSHRGNYTKEEKWLFLSFMESCGLCFQLNNKPFSEERSESDIYVFPEFLPAEKPQAVVNDWAAKAQNVHVLRYKLPYLNYFLIQSFITALGRKTNTDNIWRNGIHVSTPEGWFKVELDYRQEALMLYIEQKAMASWLAPILEELRVPKETGEWEISTDGVVYQPFNLEAWQHKQKEKQGMREEVAEMARQEKPLQQRLPDVVQEYHEQTVILFVAANPPNTEKLGTQEKEHSKITRKTKGTCEVIDKFAASAVEMNDAISQWKPHILHFCGHAEQEGLELHDSYKRTGKLLGVETLGKAFGIIKQNSPQLRAVFLNACYTEQTARAISRHDIYALGTSEEIHSVSAISFAEGFYFKYASTKDIVQSIRHGLAQALLERGEDIERFIHLFYKGERVTIKN